MNQSPTVLIVDDDPDLCYMLTEVFRSMNIHSVIAGSLTAAKIELVKHLPELIILDNSLPDGFGTDFLPVISEMSPASKIFIVTGDYEENDEPFEGVTCFIRKPFNLNKFREIIGLHI